MKVSYGSEGLILQNTCALDDWHVQISYWCTRTVNVPELHAVCYIFLVLFVYNIASVHNVGLGQTLCIFHNYQCLRKS